MRVSDRLQQAKEVADNYGSAIRKGQVMVDPNSGDAFLTLELGSTIGEARHFDVRRMFQDLKNGRIRSVRFVGTRTVQLDVTKGR